MTLKERLKSSKLYPIYYYIRYGMFHKRYFEIIKENFGEKFDKIYVQINSGLHSKMEYDEISDIFVKSIKESRMSQLILKMIYTDRSNERNEAIKRLKSIISDTKPEKLTVLQWKTLSFVCYAFGFYQAGYQLKSKSIESLYSKSKRRMTINEKCELYTAYISEGDYEKAKNLLYQSFGVQIKLFKNLKLAETFLHICTNQMEEKQKYRQDLYTKEDQAFADYVRGKSIAVVGASFSETELEDEINSYDIVVRLNYRGLERLPDRRYTGNKTDISYYAGGLGRMIANQSNTDFLEDLKFIVQKSPMTQFMYQGIPERAIFNFDEFVYFGWINMVQIVVSDLLMFHTKKIKIFKTNFFLAAKAHHKGYTDQLTGELTDYKGVDCYSLAVHEVTTQLNMTRNLWKSKIIEVDEECAQILRMDNEEIMEKYEELYGSNIW